MKALVYEAPETLVYRDVDDPVAGEDTVLIRVDAVGICGSDMHGYLGHDERRPAPLILGHEAAGVITGGPRDGTRVTINPLVTCQTCRACREGRENLCPTRQIISMPPREGAFAQWVTMPERNLVDVPEAVPLDKAALAEPLACGWHAVRLALAVHPAETVLVLGGGAIGLGGALALAAMGVTDIIMIEPHPERRAFLNARCGQRAIAPEDLPEDAQFDLVLDGVGYESTRASASAHTRPGGVIVHIGLGSATGGLDIRRMTLQEITFIGTYAYTAEDFRQTAAAIFDGRLGPLDWTETRSLADGAAAFADLRAAKVTAPKIVLTPWA